MMSNGKLRNNQKYKSMCNHQEGFLMHWGQNPGFYDLGGPAYTGILSKYMTDFEVVNNFLYKTTPCEFSLYCIIINQTPGSVPPIMIPSAHTF